MDMPSKNETETKPNLIAIFTLIMFVLFFYQIQFLKSALPIMEENLSHTIDDRAGIYENQCNKVIQGISFYIISSHFESTVGLSQFLL